MGIPERPYDSKAIWGDDFKVKMIEREKTRSVWKTITSFSELVKTIYSLILTKIVMPQARLIRRPVYIRGRKSISGAKRLTLGRFADLI